MNDSKKFMINNKEFEKKSMKEDGFYMHCVTGDHENSPTGINYHTHGIEKTFNHLDFQVVIPIAPQLFGVIMHNLVIDLKLGQVFRPNRLYSKVIGNYKVKFKIVTENSRDVLRLIFPDPNGKIDKNKMNSKFQLQYTN